MKYINSGIESVRRTYALYACLASVFAEVKSPIIACVTGFEEIGVKIDSEDFRYL